MIQGMGIKRALHIKHEGSDRSHRHNSSISVLPQLKVQQNLHSFRFICLSVKIATTRGLEVTRMSHGWAHQVSKNNMTVGPWNIGQGRESHASIGFATRTPRLPSTAPGSLW